MHEAVKVERRACARPSVIGPSASVLPASTRFATAAATLVRPVVVALG